MMHLLLKFYPFQTITTNQKKQAAQMTQRNRRILNYIDSHSVEKLLLSDIAAAEGLSLHYLSHWFRDHFGMRFQDYLSQTRCEMARRMMILTDLSLTDISVACGFSDYKYFQRGFQQHFGQSPSEFRRSCRKLEDPKAKEKALLKRGPLPAEIALNAIENYKAACIFTDSL